MAPKAIPRQQRNVPRRSALFAVAPMARPGPGLMSAATTIGTVEAGERRRDSGATAEAIPSLVEPWFERAEYLGRLNRVQAEAKRRGLDGVLLFQPESVTWLTGFFTRGYASFQFGAVPASGAPALCCRDVEAYYLDRTCVFADRELWRDGDAPLAVGVAMIRRLFGDAARLGIELSAWPLNAARFEGLKAALPRVAFVDASDLAAGLRLVKSNAEIGLMRRAGLAAEAGMRAAADAARPGASERDLAVAVCAALVGAGSDVPGPGVLSSGEGAYHLHGSYTDRVFARGDTIQLETLPGVRHYHARFMRPIKVGCARPEDEALAARLVDIQDAALAEVRPGCGGGGSRRRLSARCPRGRSGRELYEEDLLFAGPAAAAVGERSAGGGPGRGLAFRAGNDVSHVSARARFRRVGDDRDYRYGVRAPDQVSARAGRRWRVGRRGPRSGPGKRGASRPRPRGARPAHVVYARAADQWWAASCRYGWVAPCRTYRAGQSRWCRDYVEYDCTH